MALTRESNLHRILGLQNLLEAQGMDPQTIAITVEDATKVTISDLNKLLLQINEAIKAERKSIATISSLQEKAHTPLADSISAACNQISSDAVNLPLNQHSNTDNPSLGKVIVQTHKLIEIWDEIQETQNALQPLTIHDETLSEIQKFIIETKKNFLGKNQGHASEVLSTLEKLEANYKIILNELENLKKSYNVTLDMLKVRKNIHELTLKSYQNTQRIVVACFLGSRSRGELLQNMKQFVSQLDILALNPNAKIGSEHKESNPEKMRIEFNKAIANLDRISTIGTPNNFGITVPKTERNIKDFSDEANKVLNTVMVDISKKMAGIALLEKKHDLDPREIHAAMDALAADLGKAKELIAKLGKKADAVGEEIGLIKTPLQKIIAELEAEAKQPAPGPDLGEMYKPAIKARKDLFTAKLNAFQPSVDVYNATLDIFEDQIQPIYKQASTYLKALREKFTPQLSKQNNKASAPIPIPGRPRPLLSNASPAIQPWTPRIDSDFSGMQEQRLDGLMDDLSGLEQMLSSSVSLGSTPPSAASTRSSFDSPASSFPSPSLSRSVSSSSDEEDTKPENRKGAAAARPNPAGYSSASSVLFQLPSPYNPASRAPGYNPSANDPTRQRDGRGGPGGV